jgi:hypothetical protein
VADGDADADGCIRQQSERPISLKVSPPWRAKRRRRRRRPSRQTAPETMFNWDGFVGQRMEQSQSGSAAAAPPHKARPGRMLMPQAGQRWQLERN